MTFKTIREIALDKWLNDSIRVRDINDDFSQAIECEWQEKLVPEEYHNSIFCSIGEWSTNITDLLEEETYDNLRFDNEEHRQKLFRHYTRILLITSEILTDFRDLIVYVGKLSGKKNNKATRKLNCESLEFNCYQLLTYINNVCKHKIGNKPSTLLKYHSCNHHIDYSFKDKPGFVRISNSLKVKNLKTKKFKRDMVIEVPELNEIITQITKGYKKVNKVLNAKGKKKHIRSKLEKYEALLEDE